MEQHFKNYQINHKFQEKDTQLVDILWEIEKKGKQKTKIFSETTRVNWSESSVQAE